MRITESTIEKEGSCDYCSNPSHSPYHQSYFPYTRVFVVEGKNVRSVFCESCITELQMYHGAKKYKLILGFQGGKETYIELSGVPTREYIVEVMKLHNADNYRLEQIV